MRIPASVWTGAAVLAAVLALVFAGRVGRWIGVGLILAVAPRLIEPLARLPWIADRRALFARALPWASLAGITLVLLGELVLGHPPASRDHGIHYFQTRVFVDELIPRGELVGWSESLNTGYPFGDSYPVLGYLFTGFANLVSFGAISLRTSYAWGLLAVWMIALGGVAWLGWTIAAEIQLSRDQPAASDSPKPDLLDPAWAGAFAAIAWLIDPGSSREGGWNYLMFHGVWPQLLSSGLWIASLPATWHALVRPSPRSLALAGLLLGASVLAHPFGMLTAATSMVAWPVVLWATGSFSRLPPGALRWGTLVHAIAGMVAAGGVVTFLASADSMARSPVPWKPLGELASELISGELFLGHRAWIGPLALLGLIVGLRRGRALAWLALTLVVGLLVLGSDASITVLRLDLLVSAFKNLQFPRYAIGLKPVLFAFVGIGAALVVQRVRSLPARDEPLTPASFSLPPRPAAARLLACLLLAPIVVGVFDDRGRLLPSPVGAVSVLEGSIHDADEQALLAALREQASERPITVAFFRRGMGGGTYPLFAITDVDARLVLDGHIPAVNYKYQVRKRGSEPLHLLGVTHVLYDHPLTLTQDDRKLAGLLEPVGEFGPWTLARLPEPAEPEDRLLVTGTIELADVAVEHPSPREWIVRVEGEGEGTVEFPLGAYRKWQIEQDGWPVAAKPIAVAKGVPGLELAFAGPGEIRLTYVTPTHERVAGWLTVIGVLLTLVGLAFTTELHLVERLHSDRTRRLLWAAVVVGLLLVVVLAARKQDRQLGKTWEKVLQDHHRSKHVAVVSSTNAPLGKFEFVRDLVDEGAWQVSRSNPDGCDGLLGKDAMAGCTQERSRSRLAMAYRAPYLYRCLRVQVQAKGWLQIELELEANEDLAGFMVREGRDVKGLEWRLPGREEFVLPNPDVQRQHFHATAAGRAGATAIELRNSSNHDQALCFALASATAR